MPKIIFKSPKTKSKVLIQLTINIESRYFEVGCKMETVHWTLFYDPSRLFSAQH